jgi:hypothetical protein
VNSLVISGALLTAAAAMCALAPLAMSRVTVFAFAGPHNWMELRYLAAFLPTGRGLRSPYVVVAAAGTLLLAGAYIALVWLGRNLDASTHLIALSSWQTSLFVWLLALVWLRKIRSSAGSWLPPVLCLAAGISWLSPGAIVFVILYGHPLVAVAFLYLAVRRWRPELLPLFRWLGLLACALVAVLVVVLINAETLGRDPVLGARSTVRAGSLLLDAASPHLLLSLHTFLEVIHYAAWLVLIPLVGLRSKPWSLARVRAATRSARGRCLVVGTLLFAGVVVAALWLAFYVAPKITFDVYFTVAMVHVIAELPCLLRLSRL